jgi:predicted nucleic acid-binding protein
VTGVLVDSSAWISFLRGESAAIKHIDPLLADDRVGLCGPVYAEVLSGARSQAEFERLEDLFSGLTWLDEPANLWQRAAEARFALARQGTQAALIDVVIALTAASSAHVLLTRDRDFSRIAHFVPVELDLP